MFLYQELLVGFVPQILRTRTPQKGTSISHQRAQEELLGFRFCLFVFKLRSTATTYIVPRGASAEE